MQRGVYDLEDLMMMPTVPRRSVLFNLEPIGIGTSFVESLTSYIARLSCAHCLTVSKLIEIVIKPYFSSSYLKNVHIDSFYKPSICLNGNSSVTFDFVETLETLTGNKEIRYLTLLPFSGIWRRDIVKNYRTWCPQCLEEWKNEKSILYEPLIWSIKDITTCPRHKVDLESNCPSCLKKMNVIHRNMRIGYCNYCNFWLGCNSQKSKYEQTEWEEWINYNYAKLLHEMYYANIQPLKRKISVVIAEIINKTMSGNITDFSNLVGIPRKKIYKWKYGETIPALSLLKLCYFVDITISDVLLKNFVPEIKLKQERIQIVNDLRKINTITNIESENIEESLINILALDIPISLAEAARRLGKPYSTIYASNKEICKQISKRYLDHRNNLKNQRMINAVAQVKQIIENLQKEGIKPSEHFIRQKLNKSVHAIFLGKVIKIALTELNQINSKNP